MPTIFRRPTEAEKENFVDLMANKKDSLNMFLAKLAEKQQSFQKEYKPFCTRCARVDFDQKIQHVLEENSLTQGAAMKTMDYSDKALDVYGDPSRFEYIEIRVANEDKLIDGMRKTVPVGKHFIFKCTERGCRHAVYVPIDDCDAAEVNLTKGKAEKAEKTEETAEDKTEEKNNK